MKVCSSTGIGGVGVIKIGVKALSLNNGSFERIKYHKARTDAKKMKKGLSVMR